MNPVDPDVPEILTGTKNMLLFQFRVEVDLVIGKRHLPIGIDHVTSVPVAFSRSHRQAPGDNRQTEGPGQGLQLRQKGLSPIQERKLAVERDDGIP